MTFLRAKNKSLALFRSSDFISMDVSSYNRKEKAYGLLGAYSKSMSMRLALARACRKTVAKTGADSASVLFIMAVNVRESSSSVASIRW
jgi:hypothetical protein